MLAGTLKALGEEFYGRSGVLCGLTRWDVARIGAEDEAVFFNVDGSQDAWAFFHVGGYEDPCTQAALARVDFPFGAAGCDHRVAAEFARQGFLLVNPARRLRVYHYHPSGVRAWLAAVGGPYIAIPFSE